MESDKLTRKERERLRKQEEILLSAQKCFSSKGYHECTMEDIAREYECSVGSLYNFFSGKDEIYKGIFAMHAEKNIEFKNNLTLDMDNPRKAIPEYVMARLNYGFENSDFIKMFLRNKVSENFANESLWRENILPTMTEVWNILEKLLQKGLEQGLIRKDLNVVYARRLLEYQIFRVLDEVCLKSCPIGDATFTLEEHCDNIIDIIFRGICQSQD